MSTNKNYLNSPHTTKTMEAILANPLQFQLLNSRQVTSPINWKRISRNRQGNPPVLSNSWLFKKRNTITGRLTRRALQPNSPINQLANLYHFKDRTEVYDYLQENPSLFQLLKEAHNKIQQYFGPEAEVILEVFMDYEMPTRRELMALVQTPLSPSEALARLGRLYEEWWVEASAEEPLKMSIDVENI